MNAESSRSHLVFAVIVESTNLSNGQVLKGKLSLVDLAGSERAAKTGATAEQLRVSSKELLHRSSLSLSPPTRKLNQSIKVYLLLVTSYRHCQVNSPLFRIGIIN